MTPHLTDALATRLIDRIVAQPRPRDALLRFLYYTEEFVERFDLSAILPHLGAAERAALEQHFADECGHARALRALCQRHGLAIERSPAEEALIRRSDEGYAQFLRHLDPATNRFTAAEMYAYYTHVEMQEALAVTAYRRVADALDRHAVRPKFARILRAFARSEAEHQGYADRFMIEYGQQLGWARRRLIEQRVRLWSARTGSRFVWDFLRLLKREHGLDLGLLDIGLKGGA
jgi:hypothetical protein